MFQHDELNVAAQIENIATGHLAGSSAVQEDAVT
jgi:hypothetical protein